MRVIACMIKLDKLYKEIAEWEGWDAEEYQAKITCNYPKYKAETNRAFACFGNSRPSVKSAMVSSLQWACAVSYTHLTLPTILLV